MDVPTIARWISAPITIVNIVLEKGYDNKREKVNAPKRCVCCWKTYENPKYWKTYCTSCRKKYKYNELVNRKWYNIINDKRKNRDKPTEHLAKNV